MDVENQVAIVTGAGGSPEIAVRLVLSLCRQDALVITGQTIKAKDWNERRNLSAGR